MDLTEVQNWLASYDLIPSFFVVDCRMEDGDLLVVEADCDAGISSNQCSELCRFLCAKCEGLGWDIAVTVSSPGLTTPLRHPRQFYKNIGQLVCVRSSDRKLEGTLLAVSEQGFSLAYTQKERVEGKKRPVLVSRTEEFLFADAPEVLIKLGKR